MKIILVVLGAIFLIGILSVLAAYPTKWLVNYLFSSAFLDSVFGIRELDFWHALGLNFLIGWFISTKTTSASKN